MYNKYHLKEDNPFINNQKFAPFTPNNKNDLDNLAPQRKNKKLKNENQQIKENDLLEKNP